MFTKGIKLSLTAAVAVMLTLPQQASAREFADIYTECGLGAMIAPNNAAVAAVTNVTWDSGTTAISSNISSEETCQGGCAKVAAFINESYDKIEKDLASGEGEYLDTLVALSGTNVDSLRVEFTKVVASNDYTALTKYEKAEKLYNIIY